MRVLVTGAGGFIGRHVVARLRERGHAVRAVVRPASSVPTWEKGVEIVRADLRGTGDLTSAFDGVDSVVHLAASAVGDEDTLFEEAVLGTERFLSAMARSPVKRLLFASSLVVYDWSKASGTLDEASPLAGINIYQRGGYDVAKVWQERVVSRTAAANGWALTVMRPGFVWGRGRVEIAGMGRVIGPVHLMVGPGTRLPLTYVENCADCFVTAVESPAAVGQIFNVIDGDEVRVWRYAREHARHTRRGMVPLPLPYRLGYWITRLAAGSGRILFGSSARLPSLLTPCRFEAQFKPLRFSNGKLLKVLNWRPPLSFEECLVRAYELT